MKPTIDETLALVTEAFAGKVDKAGRPYVEHLKRVMARLGRDASEDEKHVALLHDLLEDADWTPERLAARGYSSDVVYAVRKLTRPKSQSYRFYIGTLAFPLHRAGAIARKVKIADLKDNLDPDRRSQLDPVTAARLGKRYAVALAVLDGAADPSGPLDL